MAEDPGHKAMLYFLEVLMNSNGPLSISQMAGRFGSRTFSAEMRQAAGGNEAGLRKFLLKYPSLFQVNGNLISLNDCGSSPALGLSHSSSSSSLNSNPPAPTVSKIVTDLSTETDAVLFFQKPFTSCIGDS
jgi:exonuclease 3'-5' domain-containing protein 1